MRPSSKKTKPPKKRLPPRKGVRIDAVYRAEQLIRFDLWSLEHGWAGLVRSKNETSIGPWHPTLWPALVLAWNDLVVSGEEVQEYRDSRSPCEAILVIRVAFAESIGDGSLYRKIRDYHSGRSKDWGREHADF